MTPTQREAMEQALKALELWNSYAYSDIITTLRAALAEHQKSLTFETADEAKADREHAEAYYRQAEHLLTSNEQTLHAEIARLKAQLAEQPAEQELIGWYVTGCSRLLDEYDAKAEAKRIGGTAQARPVYTAPQPAKRVPLTDEEIRDLWSWSMTHEAERTATTQQHAFARAIEAEHGIKGETE